MHASPQNRASPSRDAARPGRAAAPALPPGEAARADLALRVLNGLAAARASLHPRLAVGSPDDPAEAEAERTAVRVMRMPDPAAPAGGRCSCGGTGGECGECRARRLSVQRKALPGAGAAPAAPSVAAGALGSGGRPLDAGVRAFMETRFARDFGAVRVHTGGRAAESARAFGALAYTVGRDVVFAEGRYDPHGAAGRGLIAHELAHVVQQEGSGLRVQRVPVARSAVFDLLDRLHTLWSLS
ncbi:MAG TPA: DUF4157 domain-containing protein, partial [Longimicrobiaceae bacterium]